MRTCVNFKKSSGEKNSDWHFSVALIYVTPYRAKHFITPKKTSRDNFPRKLGGTHLKKTQGSILKADEYFVKHRPFPPSFAEQIILFGYSKVFLFSKPSPQEEEINCQLSSHLSWAFFSINLFIVCLVFLYKVKGNFAHLSQAKLLLFICLLLYLLPERFSLKLLHDTKEPVKMH